MDSGVEFVAVDNPHVTRQSLHIVAAVAERQRKIISDRSKAMIEAAKSRGVRIGRPRLDRSGVKRRGPTTRATAIERARQLAPVLAELKGAGMSARQIAAELSARHIPTAAGTKWYTQTVTRVLKRAAAITSWSVFFDIPHHHQVPPMPFEEAPLSGTGIFAASKDSDVTTTTLRDSAFATHAEPVRDRLR
jgi:recombinase